MILKTRLAKTPFYGKPKVHSILQTGQYNGYVAVTKDHPWYGKDYHSVFVDIHGGLTYAQEDAEGFWEFGFDTCHSGDTPERWDHEAVLKETYRLLAQIANANQEED